MVEAQAAASVWATLVPVIVGGAIGLAGGFFGPWFVESRKRAYAEKQKLGEKLEELVTALYDFDHWLQKCRSYWALGERQIELGVSPMGRVQALVSVYFPQFEDRTTKLEMLSRTYLGWMLEAAGRPPEGDEYKASFAAAYKPYWGHFTSLIKELGEYGKNSRR